MSKICTESILENITTKYYAFTYILSKGIRDNPHVVMWCKFRFVKDVRSPVASELMMWNENLINRNNVPLFRHITVNWYYLDQDYLDFAIHVPGVHVMYDYCKKAD